MDFNGAIGDQGEFWEWQRHDYDLQRDSLADPGSSLWAGPSNDVGMDWTMFDDQTPVKHCTDFEFQFSGDIQDIIVKESDEGKEQVKRRRMLQYPENVEMTSSMAEDGLSESFGVMDFSGTDCLLNSDATDELTEDWLLSCPEDMGPGVPSEQMNSSPVAAMEKAVDISAQHNSLPCQQQQAIVVSGNPAQARRTPLKVKAGRSVIVSKKLASSVAFPFELIKPSSISGDITLNDINKKIHAPPPYKIKHKSHEPSSLQPSAISGKPVVHMTKIRTEGKGSITITTTKG